MLDIRTFDARQGGNVLYKALAHPLTAEAMGRLYASLAAAGPVAVFDPDDVVEPLFVMHPPSFTPAGIFVQDVQAIGRLRAGQPGQPLTALAASGARAVLVASFDADRIVARIKTLLPRGALVLTL